MAPGIKLASRKTERTFLENIQSVYSNTTRYITAVVLADLGHRCGYVGFPKSDKINIVTYEGSSTDDSISLRVHGGITYNDKVPPFFTKYHITRFKLENYNWLGYDCAHYSDEPDYKKTLKVFKTIPYTKENINISNIKTLDFCLAQNLQLLTQIMYLDSLDKQTTIIS
jgi:hypothetical protein